MTLSRWSSDIIIMILAVMAIWGGVLWMLTKDNIRLRWLVILLIAAFKALDSYAPAALEFVPSCSAIGWFFSWDWLQYLLIILPASVVGDMILNHSRSGDALVIDKQGAIAGAVAFAAVVVASKNNNDITHCFFITLIPLSNFIKNISTDYIT